MSVHVLSFRILLLAFALTTAFTGQSRAAEIPWSTDIEGSLKHAATTGQPVLMEFTAPWCGYCQRMEKTTFVDPSVAEYISEHFVAVKVNADANKELVADLKIKGLPAILIVSSDLKIMDRISGFQTPDALLTKLRKIPATESGAPQRPAMARVDGNQANPELVASRNAGAASGKAVYAPPADKTAELQRPTPSVRPISRPATPAPMKTIESPAQDETVNEEFFATVREETAKKPAPQEQKKSAGTAATQPSFDGACLVAAVEDREIAEGLPRYQVNYRGYVLYFSSEENKEKFEARPGGYWPMLDGLCPVTLLDDEKEVQGQLQYAAFFRKRLWVFSSEENMRQFLADPADVAEAIEELTQSARQ